jgi:hypothetical protein
VLLLRSVGGTPLIQASALLVLAHAGIAAIWLGAMAYSLLVVQPRAERFLGDPQRYEEFAATLAAGARWKVLGMMAALGLTGAWLAWLGAAGEPAPSSWWITLVVTKGVLLVASLVLFWFVSWRLWPWRLFALPDELPAIRRRFRLVAVALTATVAANFVLGILAAHGRG